MFIENCSAEVVDIRDPAIAAAALALQREAYAVEAQLIDFAELPPVNESLQRLMRSDETFLFCRHGDELVGMLAYERAEATLTVSRLAVSPQFFRHGVASLLLEALAAREPDAERINASTAATNRPGIDCYQQRGFHISRRWTTEEGLALVTLTKYRNVSGRKSRRS